MIFPPMGDEFYTQHPQEVYQGEWTNMKTKLGKQTGIALALLVNVASHLSRQWVSSPWLKRRRTQRHQEYFPTTMVAPGAAKVLLKSHFQDTKGRGRYFRIRCQMALALVPQYSSTFPSTQGCPT